MIAIRAIRTRGRALAHDVVLFIQSLVLVGLALTHNDVGVDVGVGIGIGAGAGGAGGAGAGAGAGAAGWRR